MYKRPYANEKDSIKSIKINSVSKKKDKDRSTLSPVYEYITGLHRKAGNQIVARLIESGTLQSKVYMKENDVVFAKGQYSPNAKSGMNLMAHESAHVAQKGAGINRKEQPQKRDGNPEWGRAAVIDNNVREFLDRNREKYRSQNFDDILMDIKVKVLRNLDKTEFPEHILELMTDRRLRNIIHKWMIKINNESGKRAAACYQLLQWIEDNAVKLNLQDVQIDTNGDGNIFQLSVRVDVSDGVGLVFIVKLGRPRRNISEKRVYLQKKMKEYTQKIIDGELGYAKNIQKQLCKQIEKQELGRQSKKKEIIIKLKENILNLDAEPDVGKEPKSPTPPNIPKKETQIPTEIKPSIKRGRGWITAQVFFLRNSTRLKGDSFDVLKSLAAGLNLLAGDKHPSVYIEGHASTEGHVKYNLDLSKKRADLVKFLLSKNIRMLNNIKIKSFGESEPLVKETGKGSERERLRALNRRAVINIVYGK